MNKMTEMGTKPIRTLLAYYSVPAIIAMVVNAIYNVVDRIFIGRLVGEDALAGLTITFPIMMIIFAFAGLIGAGGAAILSIRLGEKDYKGASHVFGNTLSYGIIITGIILAAFFINIDIVLKFFGSNEATHVYAREYLEIILLGFIFQMVSFIFSNFIRTEGKPLMSMMVMLVSAVGNIILDYIFIARLNMGVAGAALGTIISQLIGMMIYLQFYLRKKSAIHVAGSDFKPDLKLGLKILAIGFATFISTIGTSIAMTFLNRGLLKYGGTAGVTSMGAINSLYTFFIMPIMGITQGMQPIIGYNHGAQNHRRVYGTLRLGILTGMVFSSTVFLVLQLFSRMFIGLFLESGSDTIEIAIRGLRIFILMLPLLSINLMGTAFFQSIAKGRVSIILGMLRQFIFLLPLLFLLPISYGLNGVWASVPIADALSIVITLIALLVHYRREKRSGDWVDPEKRMQAVV